MHGRKLVSFALLKASTGESVEKSLASRLPNGLLHQIRTDEGVDDNMTMSILDKTS